MRKNRRWDVLNWLGFGKDSEERNKQKHVSRRSLRMESLEERQLLTVSGSISGTVFDDANANGGLDPGETGIVGWTVELQQIEEQGLADLLGTIGNPSLQPSQRFASSVITYDDPDANDPDYIFVASPNTERGMVLKYDESGTLLDTFSDPEPGGTFGGALALVGNTLLVGDPDETVEGYARAGAVYAFDLTTGDYDTYYKPNSSGQNAPAAGDQFGYSLASLSDGFVVGVPGDDLSGTDAGAAYEYSISTNQWDETYSETGLTGAAFGTSLAADGTDLLIGAPYAQDNGNTVGKAFLFDTSTGDLVHPFTGAAAGADFGRSVAILGDYLYVGAPLEMESNLPVGKVHYYDRTNNWTPGSLNNPYRGTSDPGDFGRAMATDGSNLFVSDPYNYSTLQFLGGLQSTPPSTYGLQSPESREFGYALATLDDHVVVGDQGAADNAPTAGAAYVYSATGDSPATTIGNPSTLCVPDVTSTDEPGFDYDLLGSLILWGYPGTDNPDNCGSVEIRDLSNGNSLELQITKHPDGDNPVAGDMLGFEVKWIDSGHILASAPGRTVDGIASAGEVYLFDVTDGSLKQTFSNPNPGEGDLFGADFQIQGDYLLVSSMPDVEDPRNSGAVSVFEMDPTGDTEDAVCLGSFMTFKNHFGTSVAAMGENVLVGAPDADYKGVIDCGRAYLMSPDSGWPILTLSTESTADGPGDEDHFGFQVAAAGDNILVSAPGRTVNGADAAGAVFVFDDEGNLLQTFENPTPQENDQFGTSIAVVGDYVLVGSPYDDVQATDAGAAYLFPLDPTGTNPNPAPVATFIRSNGTTGDRFGWSVCGDGDQIVIGAPWEDNGATDAGAAYRYEWNSTGQTWGSGSEVERPSGVFPCPGDLFGWSVSIIGDQVLVTARGADVDTTTRSGKAYLYDRDTLDWNRTLQAPSPQPEQGFGWSSVAVQDNRVLVTAATLQSGTQTGDLNDDDLVGSADLDIVRLHWGQSVPVGSLADGDPSGDGFVGTADLDIIRAHWGEQLPPAVAGSAYMFDVGDGQLLQTFSDPAAAEYNFFGMSAVLVGNEVLVSAPYASIVVSEAGAVYRFDSTIDTCETITGGYYEFTDLDAGTYRVRQWTEDGYLQTAPDNDAMAHDVTIDIYDQHFTAQNFGLLPPWVELTGDTTIDEGSTCTLTLTTDDEVQVTSWEIDMGDGTTLNASVPASGSYPLQWCPGLIQTGDHTWTLTHDYPADNAYYTIGISANQGGVQEREFNVVVRNVAPTMTVSGADVVAREAYYTLSLGDVVDPGQDTVANYIVHWGDDESTTYTAAEIEAAQRRVSHPYDVDPGDVTITVDLVDEDGTYYGVASKVVRVVPVLTWDPDGQDNGVFGGAGDWWWDEPYAWVDTSTNERYTWTSECGAFGVRFLGVGGTVSTHYSSVEVASIAFEGDGYELNTAWGDEIVLTGSDGVISVADGISAEIPGYIAGSVGFTKSGLGTLVLTAGSFNYRCNTYTGGTVIQEGTLQLGNGGGTGQLGFGDVVNNAELVVDRSSLTLITEAISGSGTLRKDGAGTLELRGENTYSGGTEINDGILQVGYYASSNSLGSGAVEIAAGAELESTTGNCRTISNNLTGEGGVHHSGSGTVVLAGDNSYSGGTLITRGKLQFEGENSLGLGTIENDGRFGYYTEVIFNLDTDTTVSNDISGSLGIAKMGSGKMTLTGTNDYSQRTRIIGGELSFSSGGLGTGGDIVFEGGILEGGILEWAAGNTDDISDRIEFTTYGQVARLDTNGNTVTFANAISGGGCGALEKRGTGTLTLTAANTYWEGTTVSGGTLELASPDALPSGMYQSDLAVNGMGILDLQGHSIQIDGLTGDGTITSTEPGSITITVDGIADSAFDGLILDGSATVALAKAGSGTLSCGGNNDYSGGTVLSAGTLSFASGSIGSVGDITFDGGKLQWAEGNAETISGRAVIIGDNKTAILDTNGNDVELAAGITDLSGTGNLEKIGDGKLTLTGPNTYEGTTTISAGTLQVGNGGESGSLGDGAVHIAEGCGLVFNLDDDAVVDNTILGDGTLTKTGSKTLLLDVENYFFGGTILNDGVLSFRQGGLGPSGDITFNGGTLQWAPGNTQDVSGRFASIADGVTAHLDTGANTVFLNSALTGLGGIEKLGAGTLILTRDNTYTGGTTIRAGTLQLGNNWTTGSLGPGDVTNLASLVFKQSSDITVTDKIGGTGTVQQSGSGTVMLTGENTYSGGTMIDDGTTLQIGDGGTLGTGGVSGSGELVFDRTDLLTLANVLSGSIGITQQGSGIVTLSGTNTYTGGTVINANCTLTVGSVDALPSALGTETVMVDGTLDLNGFSPTVGGLAGEGTVTNDGTVAAILRVNRSSSSTTFSGVVENGVNPIAVEKLGDGGLELAGTNNYTGGTAISAGTLSFANGSLGTGNVTFDGGTLQWTSSDAETFTGRTFSIVDGKNAILDTNGYDVELAAYLDDLAGVGGLIKVGDGNLELIGANAYSGTTTLSAGTLSFGTGGLGTTGNIVFEGGTLQWADGNTEDISARIAAIGSGETAFLDTGDNSFELATGLTGDGGLQKLGCGTLILTGTHTYAGTTTIAAGTLQIGDGTSNGGLGDGAVVLETTDAGLKFAQGSVTTFDNPISGLGRVIQSGSDLTLAGANTHRGGTVIAAGCTLEVGHDDALPHSVGTELLTVEGTLDLNGFSPTVIDLAGSGKVTNNGARAGTLNVNRTPGSTIFLGALEDGTSEVALRKLGAGTLVLTGATANAYSGTTTLSAGTLSFGTGGLGTAGDIVFEGGMLQWASGNTESISSARNCSISDGKTAILDTNGNDVTVAAGITGSLGALKKIGSGTLVLSGLNTYGGETTLDGGELCITGTLSTGGVVIDDGILSGTGTIGPLTGNLGAVSPGANGVGCLNTGNLNLTAGTLLCLDLTDSGADMLNVSGAVDVGDTMLEIRSTRTDDDDEVFVIIDNDGTDSVVAFQGLSEGSEISSGGVTYIITYCYDADTSQPGVGNDVALIDGLVPGSPASFAASLVSETAICLTWADTETETGYTIERSDNGGTTWDEIVSVLGDVTTYTDSGLNEYTEYYYRIRATNAYGPSPYSGTAIITSLSPTDDYDNDGLTNGQEEALGTDPLYFDSDDDLLPDGWENQYAQTDGDEFDPLERDTNGNDVPDHQDDSDGDGLSNLSEFNHGTNPTLSDSDEDGVSDSVEIAQGSNPLDPSDQGSPYPSDMGAKFRLTVGDPSGSHSEHWAMHVDNTAYAESGITHTAPDFGQVGYDDYFFEAGETYDITLEHLGTIPSLYSWYGSDYDWRAIVAPTTPESPLPHFIIDDNDPTLLQSGCIEGSYYNQDPDVLFKDKTAHLVIPLLDADVDSKNDSSFSVPVDNLEEDRIEMNSSTGKIVPLNTGDVDEDGVVDSADFDYGGHTVHFVPLKLRLSENVREAGNDFDVTFTLDYDDAQIRLWKHDGSESRTSADIIPKGTSLTQEQLGLYYAGSVVIYVEGLEAGSSAIPITITAQVTGSKLTETLELEDTVHVIVPSIDADTDSDNNDEAGVPAYSGAEEGLEDGDPGKYIAVQRNPLDGTRNVPLDLKLDSVFYGVGSDPQVKFAGGEGLTLWTADVGVAGRTQLSFDTAYSASQLGLGYAWTRLYVQASIVGRHAIEVQLDTSSDGNWTLGDIVTFTAIDQELSTVCSSSVGVDGDVRINDLDVGGETAAYLVLTGNAVAVSRRGCCGNEVLIFDFVNNSLEPRSDPEWQGTMSKVGSDYLLVDPNGTQWTFSGSEPTLGKLIRVKEPGDDDPLHIYDEETGWLLRVITDVGFDGAQEIVDYVHDSATGLITEETVSLFDGSTTEVVNVTQYEYYDDDEWGGNPHDLKSITVRDGNATAPIVDQSYYRYWGLDAPNPGAVKYVFRGASFTRLSEALTAEGKDPFTASDAEVAPYADDYFQYNSDGQVVKHITLGSGCSLCSGLGEATYEYATAPASVSDAVDHWRYKRVTTASETTTTTYCNYRQQVLLEDIWNGKTGTAEEHWYTYYQYDTNGNLILAASRSAVIGYDDTADDLAVSLRSDAGLIQVSEYYNNSTTAPEYNESEPPVDGGGVRGYLWRSGVKNGIAGSTIWQTEVDYVAKTVNDHTSYFTYNYTLYADEAGNDPQITSYRYRFFSGTTGPTIHTQETILPVVETDEHGSGEATSSVDVFDTFGRRVWSKDAGGYVTYTEYDRSTGALIKRITDVDLTQTGDFTTANLALISSLGWSTAADGGKHLITAMEVDSYGRTIKQTDPNGEITYTVYNDAEHETRTYSGWDSTTNQPLGPVSVYRTDLSGNYIESLTFSYTDPAGLPVDGQGMPTGTESLTSGYTVIHSLSRSLMNSAGQVSATREYFSLDGTSYTQTADFGAEGTHYLETEHTFDPSGRLAVTEDPAGVDTHVFYDALGRVTETWAGSDDITDPELNGDVNGDGTIDLRDFRAYVAANGTAPEDTDMVRLSQNIYDYGGAGDGKLTESRDYFDSGASDYYVTRYDYDGRNRLAGVLGPDGVATILTFDNLDRTTASETYAAATYVSQAISTASAVLIAEDETLYDSRGQVYQAKVHDVQSTATLTTNYWYDGLGRLVKVESPNGRIEKTAYYGFGAVKADYVVSGEGATVSAYNTTDDTFVSVTEYVYDSAGRPTETKLGMAPGSTSAISKTWYDDNHDGTGDEQYRVTGVSDLKAGTDDTFVLTRYEYDAAGRVDTVIGADPDGVGVGVEAAKSVYTFDMLDRVTVTEVREAVSDTLLARSSSTFGSTGRLTTSTEHEVGDTGTISVTYDYDFLGRVDKVTDALGGYVETTYDLLDTVLSEQSFTVGDVAIAYVGYVYNSVTGRLDEVWEGTSSADDVKVGRYWYDDGHDGTGTDQGSLTAEEALGDTTSDWLMTQYEYDGYGRQNVTITPDPDGGGSLLPHKYVQEYDASGRPTTNSTYTVNGQTETLIAKSEKVYTGVQLTEVRDYKVLDDQSTPTYLSITYDYGDYGRVVKVTNPDGSFNKTAYSLGGDPTAEYLGTTEGADTDADAITNDTILEQTLLSYDNLGGLWLVQNYLAHDGVTSNGALTTANAWDTYQVTWYDAMGRVTKSVDYGTNDGTPITTMSSDFDPDTAGTQAYTAGGPAAAGSLDCMVTDFAYDGYGRQSDVTDNLGMVTHYEYDDLGRVTKSVRNYLDGDPATPASGEDFATDQDVTVVATYNDAGLLETSTAKNAVGYNVVAETVSTSLSSGTGYLLFSAEDVADRFGLAGSGHFVPVVWNEGFTQWEYDDGDGTPAQFAPRNSDVLVASIDFATPGITSLEGTDDTEYDIQEGYDSGDIAYDTSSGDFTVTAGYFVDEVAEQTTTYVYAFDLTDKGSPVNRSDLLRAIIYPDSDDTVTNGALDDGTDGTFDRVEYTYYADGSLETMTDQRGVEHTYYYDGWGRVIEDRITDYPTDDHFDDSVLAVVTTYNDHEQTTTITTYANTAHTTVVNQIRYAYDDEEWNQLTTVWQEHDGAVDNDESGGSDTLHLEYDYDSLGRLTKVTYPDDAANPGSPREVTYDYGTAGSVDDRLSRVGAITDGTTAYAAYTYLGADVITKITHPQVTGGLVLDYGSSGTYDGLDQFGRVIDQLWRNTSGTTTFDEYTYGYDAVGNRTSRDNELHPTSDFDEIYTYDDVYRLIGSSRADGFDQDWTLDGLGNWSSFDDDSDIETRDTNTANEITSITGGSVTPTYDASGNMTAMPRPGSATDRLFGVYDGWNRLVEVYEDTNTDGVFEPGTDDTPIARYEYDGLGRRVQKFTDWASSAWNEETDYYSVSWQLLESRTTTSAVTSVDQYIWDLSYIDAPVVRYHDSDGDGTYSQQSDYVHYYTWDANQNVTAVVDQSGTVVERYVYTPYGEATVYAADWTNPSAPTADGPLYAGYHFDAETGLYHVRNRQYHAGLGSFTTRDPIGYAAGDENLYRYCANDPAGNTDSMGLFSSSIAHVPKPQERAEAAYIRQQLKRAQKAKEWVRSLLLEVSEQIRLLNDTAENPGRVATGQVTAPGWDSRGLLDPTGCGGIVAVELGEKLDQIVDTANSFFDQMANAVNKWADTQEGWTGWITGLSYDVLSEVHRMGEDIGLPGARGVGHYADESAKGRLDDALGRVETVLSRRNHALGTAITTMKVIEHTATGITFATGIGGCIYKAGQVGGKFVLSRGLKAGIAIVAEQGAAMVTTYAVTNAAESLARRAGVSQQTINNIRMVGDVVQLLIGHRRVCFLAGTPVLVPGTVEGGEGLEPTVEIVGIPDEPRHESALAGGVVVAGAAACLLLDERERREEKRRKATLAFLDSKFVPEDDEAPEDETVKSAIAADALSDDALEAIARRWSYGSTAAIASKRDAANENEDTSGTPPHVEPVTNRRMGFESLREPEPVSGTPRADGARGRRGRRAARWLGLCLLVAGLFAGGAFWGSPSPEPPGRERTTCAAPDAARRNIETIRVGRRVLADNPDASQVEAVVDTAVDPSTWRLLRLKAEERVERCEDGTVGTVEIEAIVPPEWVAEHRASVGAVVPAPIGLHDVDLPEDLLATVVANEPCPPIESGPGRVVLTTFNRLAANLCELHVEDGAGRKDTLFTTASHRFYSEDRAAWVPTDELALGERLHGRDRTLTVAAVRVVPGVHRVYNMEVEGEHVYYVSPLGLVAHNATCRTKSGGSTKSSGSTRSARRKNLDTNSKAGAEWEGKINDATPPGHKMADQVTLKVSTPEGDVRIRADNIILNEKTGRYSLIEGKASATAPLTTNQGKALPVLGKGGTAEVRGVKGKDIGLKPGDTVDFDEVIIVRPGGAEVVR